MKPSSIAIALLSAAPVAAQRIGGGVPASQYERMETIRGGDSPPRSPQLTGDDEGDMLATCNGITSSNSCDSNDSCTWCVAGAVPSACYPTMMAARLPEGVFQCSKKVAANADDVSLTAAAQVTVEDEKKVAKAKIKSTQTFILKEGVTLTLDSAEVDKDFCDASSDLSLAGYMNVKGSQFDTLSDKNLFYWFFEKRTTSQLPSGSNKPKLQSENGETPLVIWLTGGPGCSSSLALLTENGPCSVDNNGETTEINPYSWTESAHVMWLDQPADVGYSYGQENDTNEEMISEDAYYFLQVWFKSDEGKKYKDSPLFIVGESYGGHYAPAIAHRIWKGNNNLKEGLDKLNLKGLAIGNGLTDPEEQYQWYAEFAYKNSHKQAISKKAYNWMKKEEPACTKGIKKCNAGNTDSRFACQQAFIYCNTALTNPFRATGLNPYDITKECGDSPLCYDFSRIEKFMNLDSTKQALHVDQRDPHWKTCNMAVNSEFHVDWMKNFAPYVANLLNAGIPALIYAGDIDFICNYMGNRAWTLKLDWEHKQDFKKADEKDWNNGGGLVRSSNGLTFLQVYNAGHMVPTDQPEQALTMITQFLNGEAF